MSDGEFGADFFNACWDAVKVEPVIPERFGVFDYISGEDADSMELEETKVIVENILPQGVCSILAGTTGSGKSLLSMSLGMALCNDEDEFIGFKINQKGLIFANLAISPSALRARAAAAFTFFVSKLSFSVR